MLLLPPSYLRKVSGIMKVKINLIKKLVVVLFALPLLTVILVNSASVRTRAAADDAPDMSTVYKESKCIICHGPKAAKFFDATVEDEKLVEIVLKGKKAEKPPNMPAYEEKGMSADQAKTLVTYMKTLKQ
jgi:mono/diheme cytochrome c family protein